MGRPNDALKKARRSADVFVWPENFHDRYLITDIVGILMPYGFDIATNGVKETTWVRLDRGGCQRIEQLFDPNGARFGEVRIFSIGA